jgi:hypothetical protein
MGGGGDNGHENMGELKDMLWSLAPCRCTLAVFREEARKALHGTKGLGVAVQMLQCSPINKQWSCSALALRGVRSACHSPYPSTA